MTSRFGSRTLGRDELPNNQLMRDQLAMAWLVRGTYARMISLLPATATVIGDVVLTQIPTALEASSMSRW